MEWYYYAIIITGAGVSLVIIYVILRNMKIIGGIPVISNIIDPVLFGQLKMSATAWYDKPRGKNKYYNPRVTNEEFLDSYYEGEFPHGLPKEMQDNLEREMVKKFGENYDLVPSEHDDYCRYETIGYNQRTGVVTENVSVEPAGEDGYKDVHIKYYLKTGKVTVGYGYSPDTGKT